MDVKISPTCTIVQILYLQLVYVGYKFVTVLCETQPQQEMHGHVNCQKNEKGKLICVVMHDACNYLW